MPEARPVIKWPGGKGQLLDRLEPLFPRKFNRYIEPFAGAGAVFFRLHNLGLIGANPRVRKSPAILNDLNAELMNVYCVVRDRVDDLIDELARHQAHIGDEAYYYYIRNLDREPGFGLSSPVTRAARTIFLNKTGYNGLYRVNAGGLFNVPVGQHKKPTVLDQPLLHIVSRALQRVELMSSDFARPLRQARHHDFVYIDPPYQPLSRTANFVAYTAGGFGWDQQERLAEWIGRLAKRGCYVLINNADTPEIRALYEAVFKRREVECKMQSFETARSINREGKNRRGAQELTVWNY
ncbi:MAG: Dam family site-specific DNA-(adenine-N6)-methyltransferase [Chloroflexi bacterium]|nr:Dam family site-specific DNA-(adenine-N6)-methyltransferase [Chloroflexota bacterium]